jgi:ribonuclease D
LAKRAPPTLEELSRVPYFGEKRLRLYGAELIQLLARIE